MSQLKILFVDDEESILDMLLKIYAKKGFAVFSATDGIKAVELYEKERPLIAFIDVHMPFSPIDGLETLRRIKVIDKEASCVMLTRILEADFIAKAKASGALHYIRKPFELEDIDNCIEEVKAKQGIKE